MTIKDRIIDVLKKYNYPKEIEQISYDLDCEYDQLFTGLEELYRKGHVNKILLLQSSSLSVCVREYWTLRKTSIDMISEWEFERDETKEEAGNE